MRSITIGCGFCKTVVEVTMSELAEFSPVSGSRGSCLLALLPTGDAACPPRASTMALGCCTCRRRRPQARPSARVDHRRRPGKTIIARVVIEDLHATLNIALGISPKLAYAVEKRPFHATKDGQGKAIAKLFPY